MSMMFHAHSKVEVDYLPEFHVHRNPIELGLLMDLNERLPDFITTSTRGPVEGGLMFHTKKLKSVSSEHRLLKVVSTRYKLLFHYHPALVSRQMS